MIFNLYFTYCPFSNWTYQIYPENTQLSANCFKTVLRNRDCDTIEDRISRSNPRIKKVSLALNLSSVKRCCSVTKNQNRFYRDRKSEKRFSRDTTITIGIYRYPKKVYQKKKQREEFSKKEVLSSLRNLWGKSFLPTIKKISIGIKLNLMTRLCKNQTK